MDMNEKTCSKCRETKPLTEYHKNARNRDGLHSHCKKCQCAYVRTYYQTHKAETTARMRQWRAENPERYRDNNIRNKGELRARNAGNVVEKGVDASVLLERQGGRCYLCLMPIDIALRHPHPGSLSVDHIVPISKGGDHTPENALATCLACNLAKRAKPLHTLALPLSAPEDVEVAA